jgi:hypothetical protein
LSFILDILLIWCYRPAQDPSQSKFLALLARIINIDDFDTFAIFLFIH